MDPSIARALIWAACGCGFTWLMTTAGSSVVLFTGKDPERGKLAHHIFLGFAAGVMVAASVWSLLNPAIEQAEELGQIGWIPAAGGFLLGVAFLIALDTLLPHLHVGSDEPEGLRAGWKRTTLMVSAVTLHNIPEGMSVGLLFAMASQASGDTYLGMAFALALGIGLQNFPEGAAVSLPLRREGFSRWKAFVVGSLSGIVEPIFGVAVVLAAGWISPYMPWMLAFAAGAMIYVVVEELIPEAHLGEHSNVGTLGVIAGFVIMMVLDVALG